MSNTILIIDDEPSLLSALVDEFTRSGFNVLTAENGEDGLKTAFKNHPNIILLDVVMPVMDGLTVLNKLRSDVWGKKAKVILLTNLSDPGKITKHVTQKVSGCLVKSDSSIQYIVKQVKRKLSK
jgi:DNA-binding response OmpR family regulator